MLGKSCMEGCLAHIATVLSVPMHPCGHNRKQYFIYVGIPVYTPQGTYVFVYKPLQENPIVYRPMQTCYVDTLQSASTTLT